MTSRLRKLCDARQRLGSEVRPRYASRAASIRTTPARPISAFAARCADNGSERTAPPLYIIRTPLRSNR
jgi:hypothetical protein